MNFVRIGREMTNRFSILASLMVRARLDLAWTCLCVSRILLLLAVIELITMPLTQYLWTWDHFLHGGLDFETSLLIIVTFLCFAMLRAQHGRHNLESQFAIEMSPQMIVQRQDRSEALRTRRP